jgi:hypothetical protein
MAGQKYVEGPLFRSHTTFYAYQNTTFYLNSTEKSRPAPLGRCISPTACWLLQLLLYEVFNVAHAVKGLKLGGLSVDIGRNHYISNCGEMDVLSIVILLVPFVYLLARHHLELRFSRFTHKSLYDHLGKYPVYIESAKRPGLVIWWKKNNINKS